MWFSRYQPPSLKSFQFAQTLIRSFSERVASDWNDSDFWSFSSEFGQFYCKSKFRKLTNFDRKWNSSTQKFVNPLLKIKHERRSHTVHVTLWWKTGWRLLPWTPRPLLAVYSDQSRLGSFYESLEMNRHDANSEFWFRRWKKPRPGKTGWYRIWVILSRGIIQSVYVCIQSINRTH